MSAAHTPIITVIPLFLIPPDLNHTHDHNACFSLGSYNQLILAWGQKSARLNIRCIRVLATEILGTISVREHANTRTLGCSEETLLRSGSTLIGSELSSPNFNSSVRAEQSFANRYLNVVIKLTPTFGHKILFACFRSQTATERCFFGSRFLVAFLRNLADLRHSDLVTHLMIHLVLVPDSMWTPHSSQ